MKPAPINKQTQTKITVIQFLVTMSFNKYDFAYNYSEDKCLHIFSKPLKNFKEIFSVWWKKVAFNMLIKS